MKVVAITGGIGSGKSSAAAIAALGVTRIDLDQVAREVQRPGDPAMQAIAAEFGPEVIGEGGELNRAALARIVFADPERLARLNTIVHPQVKARLAELLAQAAARGEEVVLVESPLVFESKDQGHYDAVILVHSMPATQSARLVERRGLTLDDAQGRIAAQMPEAGRLKLAAYVIDNSGTLEDLERATLAVWDRVRRDLAAAEAAKTT